VARLSLLKNVGKIGKIEEKIAGFVLEWLKEAVDLDLGAKIKPCFSIG